MVVVGRIQKARVLRPANCAIVCIAVMVLRRSNPAQHRPFRTPWVPVVPILGIVFNGYMMYKLGWINWARLIVWLIIGLVVYFTYSRHHSRVTHPEPAPPAPQSGR